MAFLPVGLLTALAPPETPLLLSRLVIITTDERMLVGFELLIGCSGRPSSCSVRQLRDLHFDCQSPSGIGDEGAPIETDHLEQ